MTIFHLPQFEHEPFWQYLSRLNDYHPQYVLFEYEKWEIYDVVLDGNLSIQRQPTSDLSSTGRLLFLPRFPVHITLLRIFSELQCTIWEACQGWVALTPDDGTNTHLFSWKLYDINHPTQMVHLFFIRWLKGWQRLTRFEMNLRIYAKWPWSPRSSLRFLGSGISWIALIFDWLISIPRWWTMKPKNFPEVTPNAHLSGFIFNWHLHNHSKIRRRSCMQSTLFLDLTTKSST